LFEQAALLKQAKFTYHRLLQLNSNNIDILYRLATIFIDSNEYSTAEKYLKKILAIQPDNLKAKQELNDLYYHTNNIGLAQKINLMNVQEKTYLSETNDNNAYPSLILNFEKKHILKFIQLFRTREDVYSLQWIDEKFNVGYKPVYSIMSETEVTAHFNGNSTLGMYCMRQDNKVLWAVIDIDINKKALERNAIDDNNYRDNLNAAIFLTVKKIYNVAIRYGIQPIIENSGNKGAHIWFFFNQHCSANIVRIFIKQIIKQADIANIENINFEIFPKQDILKDKMLGNLVKLPLGIHRKTLKRALFCDFNGNIFNNQFDYLLSISNFISEELMTKIIELNNTSIINDNKISINNSNQNSHSKSISNNSLSDEELKQIAKTDDEPLDNPFDNPDFQTIRKKCAVIDFIAEKLRNQHIISYDEKIIIIYSLAFINNNGKKFLDNLMKVCIDYQTADIPNIIKAVGKMPISCNKIKKILKSSEDFNINNCNCSLISDMQFYPTPILHLKNLMQKNQNKNNNYILSSNDILSDQNKNIDQDFWKNRIKNQL